MYGRWVLKLIMQHDLLAFALVKLLLFPQLFNSPKKHVLKHAVICAALDRLRRSKYLSVSLFFNVLIDSKSRQWFPSHQHIYGIAL